MTQIARYDALRTLNKAYVANIYGESYDVRRLDPNTNGSLANNSPIINLLQGRIWRETSRDVLEATPFDVITYIGDVDNTNLQFGDMLTESASSYHSLGTSYYYVQARPTRDLVFARADFAMTVWRPEPEGGAADQFPATGSIFVEGYGGTPEESELVLTLAGGTFSWAPQGNFTTPAIVQCGLQPQNRTAPTTDLGTPTDLPRDRFAMYVPLLPGVELRVGDRFTNDDLNASRYQIRQIHSAQQYGFSGYICSVENVND